MGLKYPCGYSPMWNLCVYSKYFTTRNAAAHRKVIDNIATSSFLLTLLRRAHRPRHRTGC